MNGLAVSPLRNLTSIVAFVIVVVALATGAYMYAGWSFGDALYMVLLTVFTVGYGEVHPISTPYLHAVTVATMMLGCTGMILVTGALVQAMTIGQIQQLLGLKNVSKDIDKLSGHVIVCGFGRIGVMLAKELAAGQAPFVVVERGDDRAAEARAHGYLCLQADAAEEQALIDAGVLRARVLATVLPDDAANVFITLSARSLNRAIQIIARGERPSTQGKLLHAGADKVVLPTHIGAERIAEMILFPQVEGFDRTSEHMRRFEHVLGDLGLGMEVAVAHEASAGAGLTVAELERRGKGAFFVVQIHRGEDQIIARPPASTRIEPGDGLMVVGRMGSELAALVSGPAPRPRAGRTTF